MLYSSRVSAHRLSLFINNIIKYIYLPAYPIGYHNIIILWYYGTQWMHNNNVFCGRQALHITVTVTNDSQTGDNVSKTLRISLLLQQGSVFVTYTHGMYLRPIYYYTPHVLIWPQIKVPTH